MMKLLRLNFRLTAIFAVFCFLVAGSAAMQAQTPKSGAMLKIDGTVGATPVHLVIYDSQIHSGHVQAGCDPNFPTDAYVLQGGSWTGCDNGDNYEITDGESLPIPHQYPGIANLSGTGYSFHIETHYLSGACNTSRTICTNPDSGFLTVTNIYGTAFTGTITLQGNSTVAGAPFCPAGGVANDTWTSGLAANTGSVTLALGSQGTNENPNTADSSNCKGFNATQTLTLNQGVTSKFQIGNDDLTITPFLGGTGDSITVLPIPVPAGPLTGTSFGADTGLPLLTPSRFSAANFPGQASIPYADFSASGNPVGLEFQVSCSAIVGEVSVVNGGDCGSFIYTMQTDFTIDPNSFSTGIGGAHFLAQHEGQGLPAGYDGSCPTTGFTVDIFLSYTGGIGDPPLLGSSDGSSCFVGTFDPNATVVPVGVVVKQQTLVGFQSPVSNDKLNVIQAGSTVPLKWQTFDSFGNPVTNLTLCKTFGGAGCPTTTPWVFIGTIAINCTTDQITGTTDVPTDAAGNSGLQNQGGGNYQYNWKTVKGSKGCVTPVLQFSSGLVSFSVANFQYK
jgi:hypothetical protein